MLTRNTKSLVLLTIACGALVLAGCVTVPDAIKGSTATPVMQLSSVQHAPNLFTGAEARFGGKVMNITNEQGQTVLEIATVPLDSSARPILGEPSSGRLLATVQGFLEPADFKSQIVTVVGPITGLKDGKIGMTSYRFVTMNATGYKRWHLVQQVIIPPVPIGPWRNWGYGYGWYNPDPAQVQIIVTE
ncbi:putative predicted lipoprotein [Serratia symbiotica str. Tucson]|uniref:Lipoprotein n=2 Tax=Serratia symbiotica TaxID=138074 RepID=A0A455VDV2_9GAMM|nr:Slp family lipoprotein [Serratia symbiotica]EFW12064.1 putative predicted lipoprotein [Serratia symbiotica str. Tucson]NIH11435.1 Slp family lipoprotein [Serratia symbiotica]BBI91329.1 lipoprotein [Serratia symbiotica]